MAFDIQIGSKIITLPDVGESADWAEGVVEFYKSVEEALATVQGPQDITQTTTILANGGSGNVTGFSFDTAETKYIFAEYVITRTFTDATPTQSEAGQLFGNYDGTDFTISIRANDGAGGNPGVDLDINNTGQVTYTATTVANTDVLDIVFKAKAIIS